MLVQLLLVSDGHSDRNGFKEAPVNSPACCAAKSSKFGHARSSSSARGDHDAHPKKGPSLSPCLQCPSLNSIKHPKSPPRPRAETQTCGNGVTLKHVGEVAADEGTGESGASHCFIRSILAVLLISSYFHASGVEAWATSTSGASSPLNPELLGSFLLAYPALSSI